LQTVVAALVLLCDRALELLAAHRDQVVPFAEEVAVIAGVARTEGFEGKTDLLGLAWHVNINLQVRGFVQRRVEIAVLPKTVLAFGA
jgi:hypothetical protein